MAARADRVLSFCSKDSATTEIYTLSLHDALPIFARLGWRDCEYMASQPRFFEPPRYRQFEDPRSARTEASSGEDRKSTRLNSSHTVISYAVFCLKKKTMTRAMKTPSTTAQQPPHC